MIDWVSCKLPCNNDGNICNGVVAKVNREGDAVEWQTMTYLPVVGSYESSIMVRSVTESTIEVSGNPAKWLQGHNLFGSNDLRQLMWVFYQQLIKITDLSLNPSEAQLALVKNGNYTVSRVDINEAWGLRDVDEVKAFIRSAGQKMRLKHRGAGQFKGDTLYWGKGSKRWFLKCYSKGDEINSKKSNFPEELRTPEMLDYASRSLRFEMTLKSNYLRDIGLHYAYAWCEDTCKILLSQAINKLEMSNNMRLSDDILDTMKPSLRMAYLSWLGGADMKQILSERSFYRYRKQLREYDIDIGITRDVDQNDSKVIPLIRVLEAKPMGIPDWAYEQGLVAC